jgi:PAS domain S-box-containing protein
MQLSASENQIQQRLARLSILPVILIFIIAGLALIGWSFKIEVFKRPIPGLMAMNPTSALLMIFAALSFVFFSSAPDASVSRLIARVAAWLVLLVGLLRLIGVAGNFDIPVDSILFSHQLQQDGLFNHIAPNAAAGFLVAGTALLTQQRPSPAVQKLTQGLALVIALLGLFSLLGYLYRVREFYGVFHYMPMAIHTAICFVLLSVAILLKKPANGFMKEVTGSLAGSSSARLLIPTAIVTPITLGYLRLQGHWAGIFTTEFGVAILVLSIIIVFLLVIWYNIVLLNKKDLLNQAAEDSLKKSEEQIQTIFNAAPNALIVMDEEGKVVKWNPRAEMLFKWRKEETIGRAVNELIIPERYREAHKNGMERFLLTGKSSVINKTIEIQAIDKHHNEFDVALSIAPTVINNEYLFIGFIRDITEEKKAQRQLKESEEKFLKIFMASPVAISITQLADTKYLDVNDAFTRLTGFTKEELIGRTSTELGMIVNINRRKEALQEIKTRGFIKNMEMSVRNKSGKLLDVLSSIETILLNGEAYAINIIYDITERKKAETELATLNKELEAFSYSVSHDLRSPLRIIDSYAKIIIEDHGNELDNEVARLLGKITSSTKKMGHLIDDLLNFSRLGRKELTVRPVNMTNLVTAIIAEQQVLTAHPVTVQVGHLEPACCDYNLIQQVWLNFISNAFKYSGKNASPVITISSYANEGEIVYSIKDNGVGFDMQYAHKLFGVFQRLHHASEFEGTGVGLALVQRIVHRHGGRVWAEAEPNKGATFYFSLPVVQHHTNGQYSKG